VFIQANVWLVSRMPVIAINAHLRFRVHNRNSSRDKSSNPLKAPEEIYAWNELLRCLRPFVEQGFAVQLFELG